MSHSRRARPHLHALPARRENPGDPPEPDVDEGVAAWEELTDDVVRLLVQGGTDEVTKRADAGRAQIATRCGGVSLLVGPVTAATSLAHHVLEHANAIVGIQDALETLDPPLGQQRMAWALALVHGIVADAGGLKLAAPEALVLLMNEAGTDAAPIASAVWWAFCQVGAGEGVGANWCAYAKGASEDTDVDQAAAAIGVAACLVGLVGAGHARLAHALASSVASDLLLPDGVAACLALVDLDRAPDVATVSRVCHETMERRGDDDPSVEADAQELLGLATRAARRFGGGEGAGLAALDRFERWLLP